jgi:O-acetyl-ADP-ribose deacetylase (regulator of RNase III)
MKYPGSPSSVQIVQTAMRTTLQKAILNGVKSIAFPGLGTGIGGLPKDKIAREMVSVAMEFVDSIDVNIIDLDKEFIDFVKENLLTE